MRVDERKKEWGETDNERPVRRGKRWKENVENRKSRLEEKR